ncbi:MAG: hypothetical protein M2R45_02373 [Verrucomicrobia subdivision 3 bacterium]|nr:hypothetical protein [Limisphaerales bacterium]MCS1414924.1 hypothetical protein [Limisphaerales bacterium]
MLTGTSIGWVESLGGVMATNGFKVDEWLVEEAKQASLGVQMAMDRTLPFIRQATI